MANLKIYGQVVKATEVEQITTANGTYNKMIFVLQEFSQYPSDIAFTLFGNNCKEDNVNKVAVGNTITVSFDCKSRAWTDRNGSERYSTDLNAWKVEIGDTTVTATTATAPQQAQVAKPTANEPFAKEEPNEVGAALPF